MYRCLDVKIELLKEPFVVKYEFTTWNELVSFLRKSIKSKFHFVYVSKVEKYFTSAFHDLSKTTQKFSGCVTCYESLNNELETLWLNSKYSTEVFQDEEI